jgi:hypothetical protein
VTVTVTAVPSVTTGFESASDTETGQAPVVTGTATSTYVGRTIAVIVGGVAPDVTTTDDETRSAATESTYTASMTPLVAVSGTATASPATSAHPAATDGRATTACAVSLRRTSPVLSATANRILPSAVPVVSDVTRAVFVVCASQVTGAGVVGPPAPPSTV